MMCKCGVQYTQDPIHKCCPCCGSDGETSREAFIAKALFIMTFEIPFKILQLQREKIKAEYLEIKRKTKDSDDWFEPIEKYIEENLEVR